MPHGRPRGCSHSAPRPDAKDSTKTIANLGQGGLSLPDRSYYLNTDAKSVETRSRFVEHMANMFQLAGDTAEAAAAKAKLVLDFETLLAQDSLDRVAMRDPNKTYNIFTRKELPALTPNFDWNAYFKLMKAPAFRDAQREPARFLQKRGRGTARA